MTSQNDTNNGLDLISSSALDALKHLQDSVNQKASSVVQQQQDPIENHLQDINATLQQQRLEMSQAISAMLQKQRSDLSSVLNSYQRSVTNLIDKTLQQQQNAIDIALDQWKVAYLGRNSPIMDVFKNMSSLPKEERGNVGRGANQVKQALEVAYDEKVEALKQTALAHSLSAERLDVTLPGRATPRGRLHPVTQTLREIYRVFADMGFQVYRSREVETDEYNFQLLNFPPNHPAREMQDSFYFKSDEERGDNPLLLRTHTSPGQIRAMREYTAENPDNPPPVRIILPGMCYRNEQVSTRYESQFTQVEGLAVGDDITFSDLKGTLSDFARRMFGQNVRTRFRASHFPFTEPSAEMDVECFLCGGDGCHVCKKTGWLEILGCGMVHPVVLKNGGYDPEHYTGFAFGMGPERITMLRHHIEDIRYFWANDLRFLEQF